MNVSRTNNPWPLSILVALSAATCAVVDHPVGTEAKEEPISGFVPVDEADLWSNEIVRECAGGIPELPEDNCGFAAVSPAQRAHSVAIVVDQSVRMAAPLGESATARWDSVREGLVNLQRDYTSADDATVSLVFSGAGETGTTVCTSDAYEVLSFSAATAAEGIEAAFQSTGPVGDARPLAPALEAAFAHLEAVPVTSDAYGTFPEKLLVLVTAGAPDACAPDDPVSALAATVGSFLSVPIPTYVIELDSAVELDSVAQAGGSERAASITGGDVAAQVEQAVRNALDNVRFGRFCSFGLPTDGLDLAASPLVIGPEYADYEQVPLLDGPEACDASPEGGWYRLDSASYSMFRFCPCTCARAARFGGFHNVLFSCAE